MISYSEKAVFAISFLFRPYNDIDIYVEDTTNRNLYEILFERILDGRAKITRIFPMGCRDKVIKECIKNQNNNSRRQLFIIDGDLDTITKINKIPKLNKLYRLKVYCSENLVIDERAFIEVGFESSTNKTRERIRRTINFQNNTKRFIDILLPLFVIYSVMHLTLRNQEKNVGYHVYKLTDNNSGYPCLSKNKVKMRKIILMNLLQKNLNKSEVNHTINKVQNNLPNNISDQMKLISGKTYLIPLLYELIKYKCGFSGSQKQLVTRLARYCDTKIDYGLFLAINRTSKSRL